MCEWMQHAPTTIISDYTLRNSMGEGSLTSCSLRKAQGNRTLESKYL